MSGCWQSNFRNFICSVFLVNRYSSITLPLLSDIDRGIVFEKNKFGHIQFEEKEIICDELKLFNAAFLTKFILGIVPLKQTDNVRYLIKLI